MERRHRRGQQGIVEEFRANGGEVGGYFAEAPMLLLHHVGARTGTERVNPLVYLPDGDDLVVSASRAAIRTSRPGTTTSRPTRGSSSRSAPRRSRSRPSR